ncbi:MAG: caspase family protein [Beijerinckiaceae bacterium]
MIEFKSILCFWLRNQLMRLFRFLTVVVVAFVAQFAAPVHAQRDNPSDNADSLALIIVNKNYSLVPPVPYAERDGTQIAAFLKAQGFRESRIITLLDKSGDEWRRWLGSSANPRGELWREMNQKNGQGNVFVYYVGHGLPAAAPGEREMQPYLLPVSVSPAMAGELAPSVATIERNLNEVKRLLKPERWVMFMVEACYSGQSAAGAIGTPTMMALTPKAMQSGPSDIIRISAAREDQTAWWDEKAGGGHFTQQFLRALRTQDGVVMGRALRQFVEDEVLNAVRRNHAKDQNPVIDPALDRMVFRAIPDPEREAERNRQVESRRQESNELDERRRQAEQAEARAKQAVDDARRAADQINEAREKLERDAREAQNALKERERVASAQIPQAPQSGPHLRGDIRENSTDWRQQAWRFKVRDLQLGGSVQTSAVYRNLQCSSSEMVAGMTWCARTERMQDRTYGEALHRFSVMHGRDGSIAYANLIIEPASFVRSEFDEAVRRMSNSFGVQTTRSEVLRLSNGLTVHLVTWGGVELVPVGNEVRRKLARKESPGIGIMLDFLNNFQASAQSGAPIFALRGGPGVVYMLTNDGTGRGSFRLLTIDDGRFRS